MEQMNELKQAKLQDIDSSSIQEQLQEVEARSHVTYEAEYGIRGDDGSFVMHFFPPGYALDDTVKWADGAWFKFRDALEQAFIQHIIPHTVATEIEAGYVAELNSFFLIYPKPVVLDFSVLLQRFFQQLEGEQ